MAFGSLKGTLTGNAASIPNPASMTGSVAVVVGDLVYAVFGQQTALTVTTVTDNLGNTYAALNAGTDAGAVTARSYYSRVTVAGTLTTISAAATASSNNWCGSALVIEGFFDATPLDANPANITTDVTSPYTCPATGVLAQAAEVVIGWGAANYATAWLATSPNLLGHESATAALAKVAIGYQAVAATTTVAPAFTAAADPTQAVLGTSSFKRGSLPAISGTLGPTEAADAAALAGTVAWRGSLAATEASDAAAIGGTVAWRGSLSATEASDTPTFGGAVAWPVIEGGLAGSEAADSAELAGAVTNAEATGTLAAVEAADTAAFAGAVAWPVIIGSLSASDASDTASVGGGVAWLGELAAAEGDDIAAIAGLVGRLGGLAATEGADVAAIEGLIVVPREGTLDATEQSDAAAFEGSIVGPREGVLAASEEADAAAIVGIVVAVREGVLAAIEAGDMAIWRGNAAVLRGALPQASRARAMPRADVLPATGRSARVSISRSTGTPATGR